MTRYAPALPGRAGPAELVATSRENRLLAEEWRLWLRDVKRLQPSSVLDYSKRIRYWVQWCGARTYAEMEPADVEQWAGRPKRNGDPCTAATAAKNRAVVSSLYFWLNANGIVKTNPVLLAAAPRVRNRNPKPIPAPDFERLWKWCSTHDEEACLTVGLGTYTALRRAEMADLEPGHVDVSLGELRGFIRKGGGDDIVPLQLMVEVFAKKQPHLLPNPDVFLQTLTNVTLRNASKPRLLFNRDSRWLQPGCRVTTINSSLSKWCRAAGVDHYTPHQLRHTGITWLMRSGVPPLIVRDLANHASLNTTMRYTKVGGSQDLREWLSHA